jgi:septal ring factor EnvC (AmiA/AmiB activator)
MIAKAVSFFLGPVGRWVALAAALSLWTVYQRDLAATSARAECRQEQLEATISEMERQRDAARTALQQAREQAARTRAELAELEGEHNAILAELAERGDSVCVIPDDVLDRLRAIR